MIIFAIYIIYDVRYFRMSQLCPQRYGFFLIYAKFTAIFPKIYILVHTTRGLFLSLKTDFIDMICGKKAVPLHPIGGYNYPTAKYIRKHNCK